jgi:ABC-type phosphate/phosphonate transport system substrate-binding protein
MFANARMYSINAPAAQAWRALLQWVIGRAEVECEIIDYPPPMPLPALWARPDMGCAFMCGYPLALAAPQPVVLAAPVPAPAAYAGAPVYWTDIVVRAEAPYGQLTDILGGRFAYTTEDSQSGYHAPRTLLAPYASERVRALFASVIGPLITPRRVVDAVLDGTADAGPLDSYAHELLRAQEPALAARLRTIASTSPTPVPPLVATPGIAPAVAERLRSALLAAGHAPELAPLLTALRLAGFAAIDARRYDELPRRARTADAQGYPRLA